MSARSRARRSGAVFAALLLGAQFLAALAIPFPEASASETVADATPLGDGVAYPDVVAGGDGVFHAVLRDSGAGTRIVYLRSVDSGRTWRRTAILSGSIGATRPSIAADGEHLAVGFVGSWTDAGGVQGEAPYLTTSDDGGASWTPARRLGDWATDVAVAVDGDRVWAMWGGHGGIRGTKDGGATFFVSRDLPGVAKARLAAGGGVVSAAYWDASSHNGNTLLAVGQGETLGDFQKIEDANLQAVGAGDGRAYTLVADDDGLSVLGASPGGAPARVHVPMPAGASTNTGDLAAGRGTLAVATCIAGTAYVVESTDWPTFAEPVAATTFADGASCRASIVAPTTKPELTPRFDWRVASHYVDSDGDGLPEPSNITGTSVDDVIVGDNDTLKVTLDGCASQTDGSGSAITRYLWSVNGDQVADVDHCEGPTIEVRSGTKPTIGLEVRDSHDDWARTSRVITPKDLLVVSLGDSVASGEGSPLRNGTSSTDAVWSDRSCHRSPYAGPALAAKQLEDADPHTAVTFVQLACSGAAIVDTYDDPARVKKASDPDDPNTGGITDAYDGVQHADGCDNGGSCPSLRPSQLSQMTQLLGNRHPDAVLISTGANDVRFSASVQACLSPLVVLGCDTGSTAATHDKRMTGLPARYAALATGLTAAGVAPDRVHITEYFDPTGDRYGVPDMRCIANADGLDSASYGLLTGLVNDDEAAWARDHVVAGLNAAVRQAAASNHWDFVGGITDKFERHGYCADEPWIVTLKESYDHQHVFAEDSLSPASVLSATLASVAGAFHPNRAGQEVYGDAIYSRIAPLAQAPVVEVDAAPPTGAASVGDLVMLTSNVYGAKPELRSVALTTTGGAPSVGAVRRLQVGPSWGAAALDGSAAVGLWVNSTGATTTSTQGYAEQLGSRPNYAVRDVHVVQAAADASRLVTGRKTLVMADLWSSVSTTSTVTVTTSVLARKDGHDTELLAPTTENVSLAPGARRVLLPFDDTLEAPEGSILVATVKVDDPPGAAEEDSVDNQLTTSGGFAPTMTTRALKIAFVPVDFGGDTVSCGDIASRANTWVAWAQQLLPVPDSGVVADLSCLPEVLAASASASGVDTMLADLDLLAREAGLDSVVGVVPDGWLGSALGDSSVGRAGVTGRSVVLERSAPDAALAHELGHNLGADHSDGTTASGAWVSRNKLLAGTDFMAAVSDGTTPWVGGTTWDLLTGALNLDSAPAQPEPGGDAYWIRGSMPVEGDSVRLDPFLDDGDVPSPPPVGSDTTRLTVVPVAADGSPTGDPVKIGLTDVEGLGGAVVTRQFRQKVVAPAGTAGFKILLDDRQVALRTLGSAPTIAVTAPAAGTKLARTDKIHVAWTVTDPDTSADVPAPTVNLLVSDDDGATWRPLATEVSGGSADLDVPPDLGGDTIKVRAVASDGVHLRSADSATFAIGAVPEESQARVAFIAGDRDQEHPTDPPDIGTFITWDQVGTMKPDGSDVQMFDVPSMIDVAPSVTTPRAWKRPANYASPVWGADDRIYFFESSGVSSIKADGSGLRREVEPPFTHPNDSDPTTARRQCLSMSADGATMLVNMTVYVKAGSTWTRTGTADMPRDGYAPDSTHWAGLAPLDPSTYLEMSSSQCPTISPDGRHVARAYSLNGYQGIAVAPVPGSTSPWMHDWRFVTLLEPGAQPGVSWVSDHELLVSRRTGTGDATELRRFDLASLTPAGPDEPLTPAASTVVGTRNIPDSAATHRAPKPIPGGGFYGDLDCGLFSGNATFATYHSPYVPGTSTCFTDFAWNDKPLTSDNGGGSGDAPVLSVDPASAPDPVVEPPSTDPVVVPVGSPAPGAGLSSTKPDVTSIGPDSVTLEPGEARDIALTNNAGAPVLYEVDPELTQPMGGGHVTVTGPADTATGLITTAGVVRVAADGGTVRATGPATLRIRVAGTTTWFTTTVHIAVPAAPKVSDDNLRVVVGVEKIYAASALLGNDAPAGSGEALRLVSVTGYDNGSAYLDASGAVHVRAARTGTGSFTYRAAEGDSTRYSTATVRVEAAPVAVPTGTPTGTPTGSSANGPSAPSSSAVSNASASSTRPSLPTDPPAGAPSTSTPTPSDHPTSATPGSAGGFPSAPPLVPAKRAGPASDATWLLLAILPLAAGLVWALVARRRRRPEPST